jgi:hypothetical protein
MRNEKMDLDELILCSYHVFKVTTYMSALSLLGIDFSYASESE